jgi:predicted transcriptional regulator of viral defense system
LTLSKSTASQTLARLAKAGHLLSLRHGVWAVPGKLDPLALPGHLTAPFPSYVSLQSALYYHGVISQIPSVIYAVSVGRTRMFRTPLGTVSIHHLQPGFFFGFEVMETGGVSMATPEKALLDYLYLRPARSNLFRALPELELPLKFNVKSVRRIVQRIPSIRRRTLVADAFDKLMATDPSPPVDRKDTI